MYWFKIRKQRGSDPPIILKYKIPVTTNFRILSYVQRRTRPPSVQRFLHVYFKKVTVRNFAFLFDKESISEKVSHIQRRTNPPSKFIVLLFILKHAEVWLWLCLYPPPPPLKKEDAVLLSNWNIKIQVTTAFWILSYVQRRTRPPSVQRYLLILNSCHKQVVHVCLTKNPRVWAMFRGGRILLQVFMLNHTEVDYVLIKI